MLKKCLTIIFCICIVFFGARFAFHKVKTKGKERYVYYFHLFDTKKVKSEVRYSVKKTGDEAVRSFVDDLVLGPMSHRFKRLFSPETRVEFCFSSGNSLYLGLSKDALYVTRETEDIMESLDLLRKNIVKNFTSFNKIIIYVGGKVALEDS